MKFKSGSSLEENLKYPQWQEFYLEALVASDAIKLQAAIAGAEVAILERLRAISHSAEHRAELLAIEDALTNLRVLKRETRGLDGSPTRVEGKELQSRIGERSQSPLQ
jgi:hypothetical protein